jgi:hypothetical protein
MNTNIGDFRENKEVGFGFKKLTNKWKVKASNKKKNDSIFPRYSKKNPLKKVLKLHNLTISHPEIAEEWDYERNDKGPEEYLDRSGKNVWWKCSDCDHSWKTKIVNRTVKKSGCPKCYLNSKIK